MEREESAPALANKAGCVSGASSLGADGIQQSRKSSGHDTRESGTLGSQRRVCDIALSSAVRPADGSRDQFLASDTTAFGAGRSAQMAVLDNDAVLPPDDALGETTEPKARERE